MTEQRQDRRHKLARIAEQPAAESELSPIGFSA